MRPVVSAVGTGGAGDTFVFIKVSIVPHFTLNTLTASLYRADWAAIASGVIAIRELTNGTLQTVGMIVIHIIVCPITGGTVCSALVTRICVTGAFGARGVPGM